MTGIRTSLALACIVSAVSYNGEAATESDALEPPCADAVDREPCWLEVQGRPGCHVLQPIGHTDVVLTFEGSVDCPNGRLSGTGSATLQRTMGGVSYTWQAQATYVDGKRAGRWAVIDPAGSRHEGSYVDGHAQGEWVTLRRDGSRLEGPIVRNRQHGRWVQEHADGHRLERTYVEGRVHGPAVLQFAGGQRQEGRYVDGRQQGPWVVTHADGTREEGPYLQGKRNGPWLRRNPDGSEDRLVFMNDTTTWTIMQECDIEAVRKALRAGFDVGAQGSFGRTALWDAATEGCHEIIPVLLQAGSDPNVEVDDTAQTLGQLFRGYTSCNDGDAYLDTIKAMIDGGLVLRSWHEPPDTILHSMAHDRSMCSETATTAAVRMIMAETGIAIDAPGQHGLTPLHVATYKGNDTVAMALLDLGADPAARTSTGKTPLDILESGNRPFEGTRLHVRLQEAQPAQR